MSRAMDEFRKAIEEECHRNSAIEIASNLIKAGNFPYDVIANCTGLTIDEVKELAEGLSA